MDKLKKITINPSQPSVEDCQTLFYAALNLPLFEVSGCIFGQSGLPMPLLNGVISCKHDDENEMQKALQFVNKYFKERRLPFSWWVKASIESANFKKALAASKLKLWEKVKGLEFNLECKRTYTQPVDLKIIPVDTREKLNSWSDVVCNVFHLQMKLAKAYTSLYQNCFGKESFSHLLGKKNEGVATGSVLCKGEESYLFNICTIRKERNKGYATAIIHELLNIAESKGSSRVFLQCSLEMADFYTRLGFKEINQFDVYSSDLNWI